MRVTLQLIEEELEEYGGVLDGGCPDEGWYQVIPWEKGAGGMKDALFFGRADDFPEKLSHSGLICIGKPRAALFENNRILYFPQDVPEGELFRAVQRALLKYQRWAGTLTRGLMDNLPLEELFRIGAEVFDNSVFLHDNNFCILARTERLEAEHEWEYIPARGKLRLPVEILNDFKINQDYLATMSEREPAIFPEKTFGYRILYQNLWHREHYLGRICVNELKRKIRPGDFYLLRLFSDMLLGSFKVWEIPSDEYTQSLSRMLIRLIEGKIPNPDTLDRALMLHGWSASDDYFCVCLFLEDRDVKIHSVSYQCNRLQDEFPHTNVFEYENNIVMLVNSTLCEYDIPAFQNRIAVFLREGLMKAGISAMGNDLRQFGYYYRQAVCAFETGSRKQETFWSYCFDDYRSDFILRNALQQFPAEFLCGRELLTLENYDAEHPSDLRNTLRIYLENDRNLARTAKILDIHRTTLMYRIERIEAICGIDLSDAEQRFRLLLGFHLLEESRGHL